MPTNRDLQLRKYGISKWKFRELKYFCLQYNDKKQEANDIIGLHGVNNNGMPKSSRIISTTEEQTIRLYNITNDIKLIEQTAVEAESNIYQYIIKSVAEDMPYEYLNVPCGRRQFYEARRRFFFLLSKKR